MNLEGFYADARDSLEFQGQGLLRAAVNLTTNNSEPPDTYTTSNLENETPEPKNQTYKVSLRFPYAVICLHLLKYTLPSFLLIFIALCQLQHCKSIPVKSYSKRIWNKQATSLIEIVERLQYISCRGTEWQPLIKDSLSRLVEGRHR